MPIKEGKAAGVDKPKSEASFISHEVQRTSTFASAQMSSAPQLGQPTSPDCMVTLPLFLILVSFNICYRSERLSKTVFQYTPTVTQRTLCARQCAASLIHTRLEDKPQPSSIRGRCYHQTRQKYLSLFEI